MKRMFFIARAFCCYSFLGLFLVAAALAPAETKILIPKGATWKYLDNGQDLNQGTYHQFNLGGGSLGRFLDQLFNTYRVSPFPPFHRMTPPEAVAATQEFMEELKSTSVTRLIENNVTSLDGWMDFLGIYEVWELTGLREILAETKLGTLMEAAGLDEGAIFEAIEGSGILAATEGVSLWSVLEQTPVGPALRETDVKDLFVGIPNWTMVEYNDASWKTGKAQFGFGDGDEVTQVASFPIRWQFRHQFQLSSLDGIKALKLNLLRDDAAVYYLNGVAVGRNNINEDSFPFTNYANRPISGEEEKQFISISMPKELLVVGQNVLAIEIRQEFSASDMSFDAELITTDLPGVPRGPYLQSAGPDRITIRWRMDVPESAVVRFGTDPAKLNSVVTNPAKTLEAAVTLTGLTPNTRYYYAIGNPAGDLARDPQFYFYTSPAPGSKKDTRIWVIGDSGTANTQAAAVRNAYYNLVAQEGKRTDLWLMLGDNAYQTGTDAEYQVAVFDFYSEMLKTSPLWPTIGNHDTAFSHDPSPSLPYYSIFHLPKQGEIGGVPSGTEDYYSFNYGNIHFVCLDSMGSERTSTGAMAEWLKADLEANTLDWTIVFFHHPPYTKGSHDSDDPAGHDFELVEMRENILPILESHGVDLVLSGHSHCYERSKLIDGHYSFSQTFTKAMEKNGGSGQLGGDGAYIKQSAGSAPNEGAVYIVAGSSGQVSGGQLNHPVMYRSLNKLGSLVLDIKNTRLDARFLNNLGVVEDFFTVVKDVANNKPPTITLEKPAEGQSFAALAPIRFSAIASDPDGPVERVVFYEGERAIGSATKAPYEFEWRGVDEGSYTIKAAAFDELGGQAVSVPIRIHVAPGIEQTVLSNNKLEIHFTAKAGKAYAIQSSSTLTPPAWEILTELAPQETNTKVVVLYPIEGKQRFFRLVKR